MSLQPDRGRMSQLVAAEMRYFGSQPAISLVGGTTALVSLVAVLFSVFYYIGQPVEKNRHYLVLAAASLGASILLYFIYRIYCRIRGPQYNATMLYSALCNAVSAVVGFVFVRTTLMWQLPDMARRAYDQFIRDVFTWSFLFPLALVVIYFALLFLFTERPMPYIGWAYRIYTIAPVSILLLISICARLCKPDRLLPVTTVITIIYLSVTTALVLHFLFKMLLNVRLVATPGRYETFVKTRHSVPKPGEIKVTAADLAAARRAVKAGRKPPELKPAPPEPVLPAALAEAAEAVAAPPVVSAPLPTYETPDVAAAVVEAETTEGGEIAAVADTPDDESARPAQPYIYKRKAPTLTTEPVRDRIAAFWQLARDKATAAFRNLTVDRSAGTAAPTQDTPQTAAKMGADTPRGIELVDEILSSLSTPPQVLPEAEIVAAVEESTEGSVVAVAADEVAKGEIAAAADDEPAQTDKAPGWFDRLKQRVTQFVEELRMPTEADYTTADDEAVAGVTQADAIEVVALGETSEPETAAITEPAATAADIVDSAAAEPEVVVLADATTETVEMQEAASQADEMVDAAAVAAEILRGRAKPTDDAPAPAPEIAHTGKHIYEAPGKQSRKSILPAAKPAAANKPAAVAKPAEKAAPKPLYAYALDPAFEMAVKPEVVHDVRALLDRIHPPKAVEPPQTAVPAAADEIAGDTVTATETTQNATAPTGRKSKKQPYKATPRELAVDEVVGTGIEGKENFNVERQSAADAVPQTGLREIFGRLFPPRELPTATDEDAPAVTADTVTAVLETATTDDAAHTLETTQADAAVPDTVDEAEKSDAFETFLHGVAARGKATARSLRTWSAAAMDRIRALGASAREALANAKTDTGEATDATTDATAENIETPETTPTAPDNNTVESTVEPAAKAKTPERAGDEPAAEVETESRDADTEAETSENASDEPESEAEIEPEAKVEAKAHETDTDEAEVLENASDEPETEVETESRDADTDTETSENASDEPETEPESNETDTEAETSDSASNEPESEAEIEPEANAEAKTHETDTDEAEVLENASDEPETEPESDETNTDEAEALETANNEPESEAETEPKTEPDAAAAAARPPVNDEPDIVEALEEPEPVPQSVAQTAPDEELEEVLDDIVLAQPVPDDATAATIATDDSRPANATDSFDQPAVQAMSGAVAPPLSDDTPGVSVVQVERVRRSPRTAQPEEDRSGRSAVRPRRRRNDR